MIIVKEADAKNDSMIHSIWYLEEVDLKDQLKIDTIVPSPYIRVI